MPWFALQVKAQFENVNNLRPVDDSYRIFCKVKCTSCQEEHPNWVTITKNESADLSGSRGQANLVMRCQFCKKESSAKFDEPTAKNPTFRVYEVPDSSAPDFQTLCQIEFRGLEPVLFQPDPDSYFACDSTSSKSKFTEVQFEDGEWMDYDEAGSTEVSIMDFETRWKRA
ncbi:DUF866-domain-containing protein [Tilletiaria anomala UBC 951]|uniref:DUF866-domain-containing protein n=1 Tax=Tilletiaria anomala (strain ATCC 24038 / CBS 436.72 / UBC 951) TaxID=1037660 RepID=A0A066VKF7_TILAU|nr:DUF866-domain-containing protein [Tilletiaria anomala UBC 951]KDN40773.1 DUF866-domain-containing protein [Tilletiaria anomala UBC 951]